jgi:membrane-bound ClpP family serine protease
MPAMAGCFDVHAQTVEDDARRMWASSQNIAGTGWGGTAQATSYDAIGQMLSGVSQHRDRAARCARPLIRDANNYEQQEAASQQILSS